MTAVPSIQAPSPNPLVKMSPTEGTIMVPTTWNRGRGAPCTVTHSPTLLCSSLSVLAPSTTWSAASGAWPRVNGG